MDHIRIGVMSAANIGRKVVIPSILRARNAELVALARYVDRIDHCGGRGVLLDFGDSVPQAFVVRPDGPRGPRPAGRLGLGRRGPARGLRRRR